MPIKLNFKQTEEDLSGCSKWWGFPDLPDNLDYPGILVSDGNDEYEDPLTFICQIRCDELAALDSGGLLPHEGMLYFFAALDYFLGDSDAAVYPGMGRWDPGHFKVMYAPSCLNLNEHKVLYADGTPACLPAQAIAFSPAEGYRDDSTRLLGEPYYDEIRDEMPGMLSLLQIDENSDWGLRFIDCGMLCFMISPEALKDRRWDEVECYLHSF